MPGKLPIVYVRGYAGGGSGIDAAVDDPLYGFNLGSTHVRVGTLGEPRSYQFESPLLRLLTEHDYVLRVEGGQEAYLEAQADGEVPWPTIWVHRFYDAAASTFGQRRQPYRLETASQDLLRLVELVLAKTGAPRVHLVAHSMGGLICRAMVQRVVPERYGVEGGQPGPGGRRLAADFVDRLFTYGTPHGGIEFDWGGGLFEAVRDEFGFNGADIFGPDRMYAYLTPGQPEDARAPEGWSAGEMPDDDNFPLERVFCLVGTNAGDYAAAHGLSAKAVGVRSDGLVQIDNALVPGANHAFVHRSHSGRMGLVNSEEGYQNLVRFLLGDVRVAIDLTGLRLPHDEPHLTWQAETGVAVRGLPIVVHEQSAAHHCPIQLEAVDADDAADRPVPLVTTYLSTEASRPSDRPSMRYTLHVRLLSLRQQSGLFSWLDHQEQVSDFDDTLVIDVEPVEGGLRAWAVWASSISTPLRDHTPTGPSVTDEGPAGGPVARARALPAVRAVPGRPGEHPAAGVARLTCAQRAASASR